MLASKLKLRVVIFESWGTKLGVVVLYGNVNKKKNEELVFSSIIFSFSFLRRNFTGFWVT